MWASRSTSAGLRLSPYRFRVVYKPGSQNPADYLSRHTSTEMPTQHDRTLQVAGVAYINSVIHHAVPKNMTIDEIRASTQDDPILQQLQSIIHTGRWNDRAEDAVSQFKHVFNKLSTADGIILRQSRLVRPLWETCNWISARRPSGHCENESASQDESLFPWNGPTSRKSGKTVHRMSSQHSAEQLRAIANVWVAARSMAESLNWFLRPISEWRIPSVLDGWFQPILLRRSSAQHVR